MQAALRRIVSLDVCACMITSRMLNALWYLSKEMVHFHSNIEYTRKEPTQARKYFMIVNLPLFCI